MQSVTFNDGSISRIGNYVNLVFHTNFGAFMTKCTILAHSRLTIKPKYPEKKSLGTRTRTNNKLIKLKPKTYGKQLG